MVMRARDLISQTLVHYLLVVKVAHDSSFNQLTSHVITLTTILTHLYNDDTRKTHHTSHIRNGSKTTTKQTYTNRPGCVNPVDFFVLEKIIGEVETLLTLYDSRRSLGFCSSWSRRWPQDSTATPRSSSLHHYGTPPDYSHSFPR